ncbi:tyrosine-type recombinase/integrase [Thermanaeromonas toyohensis]|uniref:tyrosine-type recombinase/integrase n=1 Tax=Thermanaeromonas toyohensis TaxID=161154 RepID=UPI000A04E3B3|nr:tyrosine-type recombinase/integrase [Thermanaeromonas toyohensis]
MILTARFYELRKKAGLQDVNLHALHHTYATRLLELGEDLKVVQELLGHSRIAVTADTYAHVSPKLKRDAVAKLDGMLTPKKIPSA